MLNKAILPLMLLSALVMQGCGASRDDELQSWMQQQRSQARVNIPPLKEPKKFSPLPYEPGGLMDPFSNQKLAQALKQTSSSNSAMSKLAGAEMNRRKEPLESFPLDAVTMVGSLVQAGRYVALVKVDNLLYQVNTGSYLGQNYGKVTKITENQVVLREVVQDAAGEWIEREATLQLQEKQ